MRAVLSAISLLCVVIALGQSLASPARAQGGVPPPNFKVAFIGDQSLGPDAEAVLTLILNEGADAVIHAGDLDYTNDAIAWNDQINDILGEDFPYFALAGDGVGDQEALAFSGVDESRD